MKSFSGPGSQPPGVRFRCSGSGAGPGPDSRTRTCTRDPRPETASPSANHPVSGFPLSLSFPPPATFIGGFASQVFPTANT